MSNLSDFVIDGMLLTKYTGPGGDLVIPEGVKAIRDYAGVFPENVEFTSVSLPNRLERSTWGMWLWPLHIKTEAFVVRL